ncbi:DUF6159 family protein [Conexibacter woesei]|uniref:Glycerophosphoryl diester phosphodiesterase membrane domain-containing protein n=1 Tax=Conexibacter woesei (strain DSM 14684 / CCUG 47730 / CIP 108061 / JCM 11494 / NBRC 100937 / ID131577) TaxID=469383 RepID=D3F5W7_CONWI|nr:DUF6159 family protein [Conexibacter woesei]ADB52666.1 conserved hypothetical protein [Conexibacter woesei DSM 14684]
MNSGRGRIRRGWALAKQSWAVLRADRSLALFPVIAGFAMLAAALVIAGPGVVLIATDTAAPVAFVLWAIAIYALGFIGIYCNVALAAAAAKALDGHDTTLADGFSVARERKGLIAKWAAVQLTVGVLLQLIESALERTPIGPIVSILISGLLNAAWTIATFFVIPVLALEGLGPKDALARSVGVVKERWGEGFVGSASIGGIIVLVGVLPSIAIGALGVAAAGSTPALGGVLIAIAVVGLVLAMLIGSTLNAIFRVALLRFATQNQVAAGFDRNALEHAFAPKRGRR